MLPVPHKTKLYSCINYIISDDLYGTYSHRTYKTSCHVYQYYIIQYYCLTSIYDSTYFILQCAIIGIIRVCRFKVAKVSGVIITFTMIIIICGVRESGLIFTLEQSKDLLIIIIPHNLLPTISSSAPYRLYIWSHSRDNLRTEYKLPCLC